MRGSMAAATVLGLVCLQGVPAATGRAGEWTFVLEFGSGPQDVAVDASHNVYVLNVGYNHVQVFAPEGQFLREWAILPDSRSIAIDESNVVYVLSRCDVTAYTAEGVPLRSWESCMGQGDLRMGFGIDVQDGLVYVANVMTVFVFSADGVFLREFPPGTIWNAIRARPDNTVWVVSSYVANGLVLHYSADAQVLDQWNTRLPDEQWSAPRGIAIDSEGRVFVTDEGGRVKIFTASGSLDDMIQVDLRVLVCVELDGDRVLYVGAGFPDRVMKFIYTPVAVEATTWGEIKSHFR